VATDFKEAFCADQTQRTFQSAASIVTKKIWYPIKFIPIEFYLKDSHLCQPLNLINKIGGKELKGDSFLITYIYLKGDQARIGESRIIVRIPMQIKMDKLRKGVGARTDSLYNQR
jgi:hypothetical protein